MQLQLIEAWNANRWKYNGVPQLELHLHDEKEVLAGGKKKKETEKEKKKASFGSLNYEDEAFMEKVQA